METVEEAPQPAPKTHRFLSNRLPRFLPSYDNILFLKSHGQSPVTYNHRYHALLRCACLRAFPSEHSPFVSIHLLKHVMLYGTLNTLSLNWSNRQITDIITFFQTGRSFFNIFPVSLVVSGYNPSQYISVFPSKIFSKPTSDRLGRSCAACVRRGPRS